MLLLKKVQTPTKILFQNGMLLRTPLIYLFCGTANNHKWVWWACWMICLSVLSGLKRTTTGWQWNVNYSWNQSLKCDGGQWWRCHIPGSLHLMQDSLKTAAVTHLFSYMSGYLEDDIIGPVSEEPMAAHWGTINHIFGSKPEHRLPTNGVGVLYSPN